jgi:hypothetical protein
MSKFNGMSAASKTRPECGGVFRRMGDYPVDSSFGGVQENLQLALVRQDLKGSELSHDIRGWSADSYSSARTGSIVHQILCIRRLIRPNHLPR